MLPPRRYPTKMETRVLQTLFSVREERGSWGWQHILSAHTSCFASPRRLHSEERCSPCFWCKTHPTNGFCRGPCLSLAALPASPYTRIKRAEHQWGFDHLIAMASCSFGTPIGEAGSRQDLCGMLGGSARNNFFLRMPEGLKHFPNRPDENSRVYCRTTFPDSAQLDNKPHLLLRYEMLHDDIAHVLAVGIPVLKTDGHGQR